MDVLGLGPGYVEAVITLNGCGKARIRKDFTVGKPSYFTVSGATSRYPYQSSTYTIPTVEGATSYSLTVSKYSGSCTSNCFNVYNNSSRSVTVTFNQSGTYRVEGRASNSCGSTTSGTYVIVSESNGGGGCDYNLELTSSNPSYNYFNYRVIAPPVIEPCLQLGTQGQSFSTDLVTVLDGYGNIVLNQTLSSENFSVDLSGQRAGVYLVKVGWKGQELSDRIIKQ